VYGEGTLDAKQQFRTREAVETPVAIEGTVQSGAQRTPPSRVKFMSEALSDLYERNACVLAQPCVRYLFHR
jgi:hypothetical protein